MSSSVFDKDTLLDLTVNIVPIGIMAFFFAVYVVMNPWEGGSLLMRVTQFALIAIPLVGLAVLTYVSAKAIESGDDDGH